MIRVESELRGSPAGAAYWRAHLRLALRRRAQPGVMGQVWRKWARHCIRRLRQEG